jgi:thioredoxin 1
MVRRACNFLVLSFALVGCNLQPPEPPTDSAPTPRQEQHYVVLTDENFREKVLESPLPVLVDFYSDACPPCRQVAPIVAKLASEYRGRAVIGKLDAQRNPLIADRYHIEYLPTFILFKGGQLVERRVGLMSEQQLRSLLDAVL